MVSSMEAGYLCDGYGLIRCLQMRGHANGSPIFPTTNTLVIECLHDLAGQGSRRCLSVRAGNGCQYVLLHSGMQAAISLQIGILGLIESSATNGASSRDARAEDCTAPRLTRSVFFSSPRTNVIVAPSSNFFFSSSGSSFSLPS